MLSKMNAELKKQFAAVFAVGSVFPFFRFFELFRLLVKVLFFACPRACNARIRPSEIRTGR